MTRRAPKLEAQYTVFRSADYEVTSERCSKYNCAAWAVGDADNWWEPVALARYFWPDGVPLGDHSIANYVRAYETAAGFEVCQDSSLEDGIEKIAIYAVNGRFKHAARQLENGRWASKCGRGEDIEHRSPFELEGDGENIGYGPIAVFMQRRRR